MGPVTTEKGPIVERGLLAEQWSNGSCPGGAFPLTICLTDGHLFQIVAADPDLLGCDRRNDPAGKPLPKVAPYAA